MHENFDLILTLTGAFTAALVWLRNRIAPACRRLSVICLPAWSSARIRPASSRIRNRNELAEVGVILLMFGSGSISVLRIACSPSRRGARSTGANSRHQSGGGRR